MVSEAGKCGSGQAISSGAVPEPESVVEPEPFDISTSTNIDILAITSHPEEITEIVIATFAFESQQANVTFQCKIDAQEFVECRSPQNYSNLTREQHIFKVRTIRAEGIAETPASFVWEIVEPVVEESEPSGAVPEPEPESIVEPEPLDISTSTDIDILPATTTEATTTQPVVEEPAPEPQPEPEPVVEPEPLDISTSTNAEIISTETLE